MVSYHHVDGAGFLACELGEAFVAVRAAARSQALVGSNGHLAPRQIGYAGFEVVAVAGLGVLCPLGDALDVFAQPGNVVFLDERLRRLLV